jgi:hypothetical protein
MLDVSRSKSSPNTTNKMNNDFSKAPSYAKSAKSSTFAWDGAPLQCRFSGSKGRFFTAGDAAGIPQLEMQILDWRWHQESRFGNPSQYWLDILFVDRNFTIAILPLKKECAEVISAFLKGLSSGEDNIFPYSIVLTLTASERSLHDTSSLGYALAPGAIENKRYYAIDWPEWQWIEQARFSDAAEWLAHEKPENPWILTGVIERAN